MCLLDYLWLSVTVDAPQLFANVFVLKELKCLAEFLFRNNNTFFDLISSLTTSAIKKLTCHLPFLSIHCIYDTTPSRRPGMQVPSNHGFSLPILRSRCLCIGQGRSIVQIHLRLGWPITRRVNIDCSPGITVITATLRRGRGMAFYFLSATVQDNGGHRAKQK